jgi:hypothetical protein
VGSAFYDVEGFRRGDVRIRDFEIREVGEVAGRDLLHLRCRGSAQLERGEHDPVQHGP